LKARVRGPEFYVMTGVGLALAGVLVASAGVWADIDVLVLGGACTVASGLSMALTAGLVKASVRSDSNDTESDRDRLIVIPPRLFPRFGGKYRCKEIILEWRAKNDILAEIGEFKVTRGGRKRVKMTIRELMDVGTGLKVHTYFDEGGLESVRAMSHALGISPTIHSSSEPPVLRKGDLVLIYEKDGISHLCYVEKPIASRVSEVLRLP